MTKEVKQMPDRERMNNEYRVLKILNNCVNKIYKIKNQK